ncbi:MAG: hypothetical protein KDE19_06295, partial [Caldilineaceae bacterium]|nr:hypothetical protein [Caldilineaceae bacterium]
ELASIVAYVTEENVGDVATALRNQAGADALTGMIAVMAPGEDDRQSAPVAKAVRTPLQRTRRSNLPGALSGQAPTHGAGNEGQVVQTAPASEQTTRPSSATRGKQGAAERTSTEEAPAAVNGVARRDGRDHGADDRLHSLSTAAVVAMAQRTADRARNFFTGLLPERTGARHTVDTVDGDIPQDTAPDDTGAAPTARRIAPQQALSAPVPVAPLDESEDAAHPHYRAGGAPAGTAYDTEEYAAEDDATAYYPTAYYPTADEAAVDERNDEGLADDEVASPVRARRADATQSRMAFPQPAMGRRARLFALIALSILLLTVVTVATVFWTAGRSNVAAADELLARAESSYLSAQQALDVDDKVTARLNLLNAQAFIAEANGVVGTRMERADQLSARVEQQLSDLLQVQPLHALAAPLVRFPESAQPQRVVVSDQDIYVLDTSSARQAVQYFELDPTRNIVTNLEGETILSQGDVINGVTVGRLVDITWLPAISGVDDKAYLLVLDSEHNLFRYDRRVEGTSHINLGGQDLLRAPTQMRVYADRLYLADTGVSQIYRYGRGNFSDPPEAWFGEEPPSISSLRSMAIDGSIWLLLDEGLLLRFNAGTQAQFSLESGFGQIEGPVDLAVGNESTSSIYVADSPGERILVFDKSGKYLRQLQAPEGDALRNLRGIFVDEIGGVIYILTQSSLFQHPLIN